MTDAESQDWGLDAREWLRTAPEEAEFRFAGEYHDLDWLGQVVDALYRLGAEAVAVNRPRPLGKPPVPLCSSLLVKMPTDPVAREALVWYIAAMNGNDFDVSPRSAQSQADQPYGVVSRFY